MFWKYSRAKHMLLLPVVLLTSAFALAQHFTRTDLTVNQSSVSPSAPNTDANMVNAWGLARSSSSPWWVAANGTGLSTLYNGDGIPQSLVVKIPAPKGSSDPAAPTGTVYNYTSGFQVRAGNPAKSGPAIFLFVTEDGTISGWSFAVDPANAIIAVNRSGKASYKGCALAHTKNHGDFLYATNFQSGKVEVFDSSFNRVHFPAWAFTDPRLPKNFVPFNIQNVGGNLVVTFAHREPGEEDEDHGAGLGYVSVFDPFGRLIQRLQHGDFLNAPWGVTLAPADFGTFSHRLLIGNFGSGTINAFDLVTGNFVGSLKDATDHVIAIDGLWALGFGNNANAGSATELFFTAGPNDEGDGLFGKVTPLATENRGNTE